MNKAKELAKIKAEMEANKKLPLRKGANLVFGVGSGNAELVFIGEAPGFHENKHMEPFVGRAGQLLNKFLDKIKIPRSQVYITNIVKHRPPGNRDPLPKELEAYEPYLTRELEIIKPKIIATLGRFSMNYFMPNAKISEIHGKINKIGKIVIYPLYHPAAALRSTKILKTLEKDFIKIKKVIKNI